MLILFLFVGIFFTIMNHHCSHQGLTNFVSSNSICQKEPHVLIFSTAHFLHHGSILIVSHWWLKPTVSCKYFNTTDTLLLANFQRNKCMLNQKCLIFAWDTIQYSACQIFHFYKFCYSLAGSQIRACVRSCMNLHVQKQPSGPSYTKNCPGLLHNKIQRTVCVCVWND